MASHRRPLSVLALLALTAWPVGVVIADDSGSPLRAVPTDPPRDAANPTRNEAVWIPSGGVDMNGVMYVASGAGPHPTVLNLHGLPGNEQNLDLAQSLRRAGYNVLSFHYRGTWGSPGPFTLAGGIDDSLAAFAFLRDPAVVARFHIDPNRLIVLGHSYGGFTATRVAESHPDIAALILVAPWNPSQAVSLFKVPEDQFAAAAHAFFDDVAGRTGSYSDVDMARELLASGARWQIEGVASAIRDVPTLAISATHDTHDDSGVELIDALRSRHAAKLRVVTLDTDHAFSDHRIALAREVIRWLGPGAAAQ